MVGIPERGKLKGKTKTLLVASRPQRCGCKVRGPPGQDFFPTCLSTGPSPPEPRGPSPTTPQRPLPVPQAAGAALSALPVRVFCVFLSSGLHHTGPPSPGVSMLDPNNTKEDPPIGPDWLFQNHHTQHRGYASAGPSESSPVVLTAEKTCSSLHLSLCPPPPWSTAS